MALACLQSAGFWIVPLLVAAAATVGIAARVRGRSSLWDLLLILAWLHPGWSAVLRQGEGIRLAAWTGAAVLAALILIRGLDRGIKPASPARSPEWLLSGFAVVLALTSLRFPTGPDGTDVDNSWTRSLVHFHEHGWRAGIDWVFTMGPLGWLHQGTYVRGSYAAMIGWMLATAAGSAAVLTILLRELPDRTSKILAGGLLLLLVPLHADSIAMLCMVGVTLLLIRAPQAPAGLVVLGAVILALVAWIKFTFGVLAVGLAVVIAAVRWRSTGLPFALLFFSVLLALWASCLQPFSGLAPYVRHSLTMASGYSEAMPQSHPRSVLGPGIAALAVAATSLVWSGLVRPRHPGRIGGALAALLTLALSWKAGFVREDPYHTLIFFAVATLLPWLVAAPEGRTIRVLRLLTIAPFLAWVFVSRMIWPFPYSGLYVARPIQNAVVLAHSAGRVGDYERTLEEASRRFALPEVRRTVGTSSVDMLGSDQGVVFLNDLTWKPRPVFQSYAAYSEPLARMNAEYFEGDGAPEYVLFRPDAIDGRLPPLEDGLALRTILRRYRPELLEKPYLLLRRKPGAPAEAASTVVLDRDLAWDEAVDLAALGSSARVLSLDLRPTAAGRLETLLFRSPPVFCELTDSRGATATFRLLPSTARLGFLIDPLLLTTEDAAAWFRGESGRRVTSLKVLGDAAARRCFEPRIGLRVLSAP